MRILVFLFYDELRVVNGWFHIIMVYSARSTAEKNLLPINEYYKNSKNLTGMH